MATTKRTVPQRDFALGSVRPDGLEREDTDLVNRSLKTARNTMILSTGAIQERPGSFSLTPVLGENAVEIEPAATLRFIMVLVANGLQIVTDAGEEVVSFDTAPWSGTEDLWITDLGDTILMGAQEHPIHALTYEDGTFSFGELAFSTGAGGSSNQPYYSFGNDITLKPSGRSGSITLEASADFFNANHVGQRIRYGEREMTIDAVTDGQTASATVLQQLPPTVNITVSSSSGYLVGESVEHSTLGGQGIITAINGNVVTVFVTQFFTGFDGTGANLVAPNARSGINFVVNTSPAAVKLWDEPMMSPNRGYPGYGTEHDGRVIFCDFPQAQNAVAISAQGTINDFLVGTTDSDAIIDTVSASTSRRVLYAVSAEDLLLLTTEGCYYQETREGSPLTPANWDPEKFDTMGAAPVRPAQVHDGVIFVGAIGQNIYAAILQGDVFKAWSVVPLSDFHSHLINSPVRLSATDNDSARPERFIFVINGDGTVAIMRWERGPAFPQQSVGWVPWTTEGNFKSMFMAFGQIHAVIERTIASVTQNFLERFDDDANLDASTGFQGGIFSGVVDENGNSLVDENGDRLVVQSVSAAHLNGSTAAVFVDNYDLGDFTITDGLPVDDEGNLIPLPDGTVQVGLPIDMLIEPWSRRSVETPRGKRESQRIIRLTIGVFETLGFEFNGESFGGYRAGEDLDQPPSLRTEHVHFYPGTRDHYQVMPITKNRPGPFTLTILKFKVQV